jgi:hypothetical protein
LFIACYLLPEQEVDGEVIAWMVVDNIFREGEFLDSVIIKVFIDMTF